MTKGIDLSVHNGKVDFQKVKNSGHGDFVILRAGYGRVASQKDARFEEYYAAAKAAGIPVGAYWYSYAMSEDEARQEADVFLSILKGKQFEMPVFYDVEEQKQFNLGKAKVSAIIRAFLERVESQEYWVGLYGSYSSLTTFTDADIRDRYAIWLAHWGVQKSPYKGQYGMWQYGTGTVAGCSGKVDVDECYVDYPTLIKEAGDNGFPKSVDPIPDPTPERAIKKGDRGADVKKLQTALVKEGYLRQNEIDGDFGKITLGAVCAYQLEHDIPVTGIADERTLISLGI